MCTSGTPPPCLFSILVAKHFLGIFTGNRQANSNGVYYLGGYFNTTAAITALDFKVDSGNIDSGTIDMYGVL